MCEADGHVQLPLLWLARTESLFTCKACLTVALMGCPLVTLPVCELAGHGQAPATGPLCFDHFKPLTDLCLDVVLTIEQKGVLIAANGTLGWIDSVVQAAPPTIVVLCWPPRPPSWRWLYWPSCNHHIAGCAAHIFAWRHCCR